MFSSLTDPAVQIIIIHGHSAPLSSTLFRRHSDQRSPFIPRIAFAGACTHRLLPLYLVYLEVTSGEVSSIRPTGPNHLILNILPHLILNTLQLISALALAA
eukprot:1157222-Pelagomonas_calceolata.AAC.5